MTDLELAYNEAVGLMQKGDVSQAEAAFRNVVAMTPSDEERERVALGSAWGNLGSLALSSGRLAQAIEALERAEVLDPKNAVVQNNLAVVRLIQGRTREAFAILTAAIPLNPQYIDPYNNLAHLYLVAGRLREAAEILLQATRLEIGNRRTLVLLARLYRLADLAGPAEALREQWVQIEGGTPDARVQVARLYLGLDQVDHARKLAEAIQQVEPDHDGLVALRGQIALAEGRWADAADQLGAAVARLPDDLDLHNDHVMALKNTEDLPKALEVAVAFAQRHPDNPHAWFLVGAVHEAAGRDEEAQKAFRQTLELSPPHAGARMNLAIHAAASEHAEKAVDLLESALSASPFDPSVLYNLGRILAVSGIDFERGIRLLGLVATGQGEIAERARDFIDRLHDGIVEPDQDG